MSVERILPLLTGVKQTSDNSWIAKCCVHEDRNPSLSITEKSAASGELIVLMHCFSCGASGANVCDVLGIPYSTMYPDSLHRNYYYESSPLNSFPAKDILQCIADDALYIELVCREYLRAGTTSDEDVKGITEARLRLEEALSHAK